MGAARSRRRRFLLGFGLLVPLALGAVVWLVLSGYLERRAAEAIEQAGTKLNVYIEYATLDIQGTSKLVLTDVVVTPRDALPTEGPIARVARIEVDVEVASYTEQKARLVHVLIEAPQLALVRREDGTDNFAVLRSRLESLIRPSDDAADAQSQPSGLWKYLDKAAPTVEVTNGQVAIVDKSDGRSLLPSALPAEIHLAGLGVTMKNQSVLMDELQLEMEALFDLPQLASKGRATLAYDRQSDALTAGVELLSPLAFELLGQRVSVDRVGWFLGGAVRLGGVRVGQDFAAEEVTVWPRDAAMIVEGDAQAIERLLARVDRVELVQPTIHMAANGRLPGWMESLARPGRPRPVPAASSRAKAPAAGKRPKLRKAGAVVREWLSAHYEAVAAQIRRGGRFAHAAGSRFPLPELVVKKGTLLGAGDEPGQPTLFDLKLSRTADRMLALELGLAGEEGQGDTTLSGRLQLDTGDIQLHLAGSRLALYPLRSVLPTAVVVSKDTVLLDCDLRVLYSAALDRFEVHGKARAEHITLNLPTVAPQPMADLTLGGKAQATLDMQTGTLELTGSRLLIGEVDMGITLKVTDLEEAPIVTFGVHMERVSARKVIAALPVAFLGPLEGMRLAGDVSWDLKGSIDTRDMRSLEYKSVPLGFNIRVESLGQLDFAKVLKPFTQRSPGGGGKIYEFKTGPGSRGWTPLSRVTDWMPQVLTTTEDGTFWRHGGIAFFAMKDALIDNLERGRFYRGASTLTQQLVKNVFLVRGKTLSRKAQELFLAWQIEKFMSKERILELYLNIVELGPGVYGIKKAAHYYFKKSPAELTLTESAFLASILPSPRKYHYMYRRGAVSENWRKGLERIVAVMHKRGKVSAQELRDEAPYRPEFVKKARKPE